MNIPVIALDFDHTIATYAGWRNEGFTEITGEPLGNVKETIALWRTHAFVFVYSVRCGFPGGIAAIAGWLEKYGIEVDGIARSKPRADVYIDDLAVRFEGSWIDMDAKLEQLGVLKVFNKSPCDDRSHETATAGTRT